MRYSHAMSLNWACIGLLLLLFGYTQASGDSTKVVETGGCQFGERSAVIALAI